MPLVDFSSGRKHQQRVGQALASALPLSPHVPHTQEPQVPQAQTQQTLPQDDLYLANLDPIGSGDDYTVLDLSLDTHLRHASLATFAAVPPLPQDSFTSFTSSHDLNTDLLFPSPPPSDQNGSTSSGQSVRNVNIIDPESAYDGQQTASAVAPPPQTSQTSASEHIHEDLDQYLPTLHIAALRGRTSIIPVLLDHGLDIHEPDFEGRTALHLAAMNGHTEAVRILLQRGAAINMTDSAQRTPIHWAALQQKMETLQMLIGCGADVNATDKNLWTVAHICVERGWEAGLTHVLRAGGDIYRRARKCDSWKREEPIAD